LVNSTPAASAARLLLLLPGRLPVASEGRHAIVGAVVTEGVIAKSAGAGALAGIGGRYMMGRNASIMGHIATQHASQNPAAVTAATNKIASQPPLMAALRRAEQALTLGSGQNADSIQQQTPVSMGRQLQPAYAKGGKVKRPTHEYLVQRLMKLAEEAKREEKRRTAPILNMPDDTVTLALRKAQEAI
jgi:hypothetical protein